MMLSKPCQPPETGGVDDNSLREHVLGSIIAGTKSFWSIMVFEAGRTLNSCCESSSFSYCSGCS